MTFVPNIELNNGVEMPQLGLGVFQVPDFEAVSAVSTALEAGYRSIDTAAIYGNERGVGRAIASSGIPREEVFVTTKLWNAQHGYDRTLAAFDASLDKLGLDQVDLYLIHWPTPARDLYLDSWQAFEKILADGRARAVGVSNFEVAHLQRLLDHTGVVPAVNQIELHPMLQQKELRDFHAHHGIVTEAWSPLAQGSLLKEATLTSLAQQYRVTTAQIILRWHIQVGNVVIPKSVTPERIRKNFDVFDFKLSDTDLKSIAALECGRRVGPHPNILQ
ncbi:aldo/keto reductase [Streptomyces sp. NPDC057717]|uniref:aldo/keto reductase n=1 Tax=Streptomyces sp. NPDC057717 TaxID=3346224 RepID=UPI003675911A